MTRQIVGPRQAAAIAAGAGMVIIWTRLTTVLVVLSSKGWAKVKTLWVHTVLHTTKVLP